MKKHFLLTVAAALSAFFVACEEEAIPLPLPSPFPEQAERDTVMLPSSPGETIVENNISAAPVPEAASKATPAKKADPVRESAPVKAAAPARAAAPASRAGGFGQSNLGRHTIQIGVFPSEASAKALVKKMSANGISAYYARVNAPDPKRGLCSIYYRVRIGFFEEKSDAESFAKAELNPLGYSWWVDRRSRDGVGDSDPSAFCGTSAPPPVAKAPPPPPAKAPPPVAVKKESELEAAKREYQEITAKNAAAAPKAPPPPPPPAKAPPPVAKTPPPPAKAPPPVTVKKESDVEAAKREYQAIAAKNAAAKGAPPPVAVKKESELEAAKREYQEIMAKQQK